MKPGRSRVLRWIFAIVSILVTVVVLILLSGVTSQGHTVRAAFAPNHEIDFDFSDPPCEREIDRPAADDELLVRYLGVGGIYIEWAGEALLTAPYFSNFDVWRASFGEAGWDDDAITEGLQDMPLDSVSAVLVGHGHYDHIGDLPPILRDHAPNARVYANRSAVHVLSAFDALRPRLVALNGRENRWLRVQNRAGRPLPLRVMPLLSEHAPQLRFYEYGPGDVTAPWDTWDGHGVSEMRGGQAYSFLIDLLRPDDSPAYRLIYFDAAANSPFGLPPDDVLAERKIDLAVLCVPSHWLAEGYPEDLLMRGGVRHVMAVHYEDFFAPRSESPRFVRTLSDARVETFLASVDEFIDAGTAAAPSRCCCGPCGPRLSMPLPGEWLAWPVPDR